MLSMWLAREIGYLRRHWLLRPSGPDDVIQRTFRACGSVGRSWLAWRHRPKRPDGRSRTNDAQQQHTICSRSVAISKRSVQLRTQLGFISVVKLVASVSTQNSIPSTELLSGECYLLPLGRDSHDKVSSKPELATSSGQKFVSGRSLYSAHATCG